MSIPPKADELALHERVLQKDPVAPVDVYEIYMPLLLAYLKRKGASEPDDEVHDSAIDGVAGYLDHPERYDPKRARLFTYLLQTARRRAIDRYRSSTASVQRDGEFAAAVELQATPPKEELETKVEAALALKRLEQYDLCEIDQAFLRLILQGERSTSVLAEALELGPMPEDELRREVKRHRDRLMKLLARLGKEDSR